MTINPLALVTVKGEPTVLEVGDTCIVQAQHQGGAELNLSELPA